MGLSEPDDSSIIIGLVRKVSVTIPVIVVKLPNFYRSEPFFTLNLNFCLLDTVAN